MTKHIIDDGQWREYLLLKEQEAITEDEINTIANERVSEIEQRLETLIKGKYSEKRLKTIIFCFLISFS